jgi:hypothetical protein
MLKNTKKFTFLVVCSLFVLLSCSKNVQNCKILPKVELGSAESSESDKKSSDSKKKLKNMVDNRTTHAQVSCNF